MKKENLILLSVLLAFITLLIFSSCYRQGYGCKGNSKIMTRVKQ